MYDERDALFAFLFVVAAGSYVCAFVWIWDAGKKFKKTFAEIFKRLERLEGKK